MTKHSHLVLSQTDGRPLYLQIIEQIKQRIAAGDWRQGQELPSIRALAAETRVSVITVKRAYMELEREGVIVTRQGKGSFVAETADLDVALRVQQLDEHLAAAASLADLLGLGGRELQARLAAFRKSDRKDRA
jgi:GntR family transcriptional regulator